MINSKKLLKFAKKWQKLTAIRRKRITSPQTTDSASSCSTSSSKAEKGHFVVYSADQKRFLLSLEYLNNEIIRELFDMAEEEFGLPSGGPLMLPCDAELMEYAICLIKNKATRDAEQALLTCVATNCGSSSVRDQTTIYQLPICSF
ncbi:auxin-responsive protein SAUR68-like [Mercurialis annua]|uniref:auxin-responsive protein SAUR68-like n=1 Tax=Mercurialis annua TaxID=3986 RepID=UPI0021605230|nr:auxin-responsive protein SAUR68-like [Mercurialis annua]